jgi:peptidoglycan/LPS O-acetylase OafA/YrhL
MEAGAGPNVVHFPGRREVAAPDANTNFHLLRLVFASMVAIYHLIVLSNITAWQGLAKIASLGAEVGVQGFFVLSGYLVYGSFERSRSLKLYAEKRVRRLYPAYATVVTLCAIAAYLTTPAARLDLGGIGRYWAWNMTFLNFMEPELPGVFASNRFHEVNGALWTLKIEVMFYIALPVLAWVLAKAGRYRWALIALIYAGAEFWRWGLEYLAASRHEPFLASIAHQLPGQISFFITGVALWLARGQIDWKEAGGGGFVILAVSFLLPGGEALRALGLGAVSLWVASSVRIPFNAARFGDLSYGLYILHFPVIQTVAALGLFAVSPWLGAPVAIAAALILALLMWRFVELRFLRPDSAYRRETPSRLA